MLAALGDLIDDIVVRLDGTIRHATDTAAEIAHRQGGSAANVCAATARFDRPSRLLAQVGDDRVGRSLLADLAAAGVDTSMVRTAGATGTIVVLVDDVGERSMLVDRRTALALDDPLPAWLDGVHELHVPLYSLTTDPLATTARSVIADAHRRDVAVSIDVSSVALIDELGADVVRTLLGELAPAVVFANADEAAALAVDGPLSGAITIIKRGADAALVHRTGREPVAVPAELVASAADTTGAGDTFAAGFLASDDWSDDPIAACASGHRAAAELLRDRAI